MHLRESNGWKLYGGIHPDMMGCRHDGREICDCPYHLVNEEKQIIQSFDNFGSAESAFCKETGEAPLAEVLIHKL